tara:strand:- start:49 stop:393 length:345 start_codon:yes stop_codon:yes gene_type:complete
MYFKRLCWAFLLLIIFSCQNDNLNKDLPNCIHEQIQQIENGTNEFQFTEKVYRYRLGNEFIYYFQSGCCDMFNYAFDENCDVICIDGGFAGISDGERCEDFYKNRKDEVVIWEK